MKIIAETQRLLIREINMDDAENMFQLHSNAMVQKYTGEPVVDDMSEIIKAIEQRHLVDYKTLGYGRWAVILKSTKEFTGWSGLKYLPEFDEIDLGYRFFPDFWGKGIATEAALAIIKYGFEELKLPKIIAIAMPENKASIKVMENAGMDFDKIAPYDEEIPDAIWFKINS